MSEAPTLVYLEADDEVTTVVRRVRGAEGERVVLVAPGRSRATSSVVALRLLAALAAETGVRIEVVGDALTRSLAAEAGLGTYASVEDARGTVPAPPGDATARHASIHVVRGEQGDDTVAGPAVVTTATEVPDEATQLRPVAAASPPSVRAPRRSPGRPPRVAALLALAAVLLVGGVVGAVILPAATVEITPVTTTIGPVEYEIAVPDADRIEGEVDATATVTATGTYPIQAAATGAVVLFNFNTVAVTVEQGIFVAAGEQAFGTVETIVVPAGQLTSDGRIQAGEASVGVAAAVVGEAANVPAQAIDTVVHTGTAAALRGFPNNPERLVVNPEATTGGVDTTGPEITQADVDAAVAALRTDLDAALAVALGSTTGLITADAMAAPEPAIEGLDGLAGTRDEPEVQINGTLAYDRLTAERAVVVDLAEQRLVDDETVRPAGHDIVGVPRVTIASARADGQRLLVDVSATGTAAPRLAPQDVLARVRGRPADEAEAALESTGTASVDLWPGWVTTVPELDWRIDLRIIGVSETPQPSGSRP